MTFPMTDQAAENSPLVNSEEPAEILFTPQDPTIPREYSGEIPKERLTRLEIISPQRAGFLLTKNVVNRKIRRAKVEKISADIIAGAYDDNGETIKCDCFGNLIDGQHRLGAILLANKSITTEVCYGLSPKSQRSVDTGAPRSGADHLKQQGEINTVELYTTLNFIYNYSHGKYNGLGGGGNISNNQRDEMLHTYPEVRESVIKGIATRKLCPKAVSAFANFLGNKTDPATTRIMWDILTNYQSPKIREEFGENHVVLQLAERLRKNKYETKTGDKASPKDLTEFFIVTFNLLAQGETTRKIRWPNRGKKDKNFQRFDNEPEDFVPPLKQPKVERPRSDQPTLL